MPTEPDGRTTEALERTTPGLRNFIRRRLPDPRDAEDVLQEVFAELLEANRLLVPIEHVTAWLYRVARNRIVDLIRRRRPDRPHGADDDRLAIEEWLPSAEDGPEAMLARSELLDALAAAIEELPPDQREVFVAHEIEGRSFAEIAEASGTNLNTLLSRKHYAVRRLRQRLQGVWDAFAEE